MKTGINQIKALASTLFSAARFISPFLSGDGKYIGWVEESKEEFEIVHQVLSVRLESQNRFKVGNRRPSHLRYSPDLKYCFFFSELHGSELYVLNRLTLEDGSVREITPACSNPQIIDEAPGNALILSMNFESPDLNSLYKLDGENNTLAQIHHGTSALSSYLRYTHSGVVYTEGTLAHPHQFLVSQFGSDEVRHDLCVIFGHNFRILSCQDDFIVNIIVETNSDDRLIQFDLRTAIHFDKFIAGNVRIGSEILYRQPTRSVIACLCEGASADWNPVATYADFFSAIAAVAGAGFFIAAASWDGAVLLVRSTDPARSPTWYLAEKNPLSCSDIGLDCPSLQRIEIAPMELFSFPAHDGTYIYGYLTRSFSPSENGFILLLHGGPHDRDHYTFRRDHQFFSHLGFNVASINFRGSTGFGPIFRSLGYRSWGGEMQSDVYSAADWGLREGLAPNGKLFIVGASYGGYSALLAANQSDTPFAAVAAINPVVDLVALIREAPTHWASYRSLIIDRIGDPDDPLDTIRLIKNSPISSVHTIVSRVLLVVGSNDGRLNAKRTFEYFINARATGAAIEMVNYTDQGHVLRTLSIQAEILTKIAHFFLEPDLSSE